MIYSVCLGILYSQSYTISGSIFDSNSKKPIKNVNAYIYSENCPVCASCGNKSNIDGSFLIICDNLELENIMINIEMIGYQSKSFSLDSKKEKLLYFWAAITAIGLIIVVVFWAISTIISVAFISLFIAIVAAVFYHFYWSKS